MANATFDHEHLRAECQRYLTSFRVLELKELLKLSCQSTKGRKPELFRRANDLLQYGSPKFQTNIREIYKRSNSSRKLLNYNRAAQKSSPVKSSAEPGLKSPSRAYIVHPDVTFKPHPFFSKLDTIIRPTALMSCGGTSHGSLNMKIKFHLSPQHIHEIYVSKTSTGTYQTQVLVRFCLQETTCEQNDFYPKQCFMRVNGHNCPIPGYHPHLSSRPDYKRNGQPVNITNFVKTSPAEANEVIVYWSHDIMLPQGYCVGVDVARSVSSTDLLQALKAKGLRSPDMSRALVKEKFVVDKDSEVAATSLKVSLICPIGKMRMSYPCRTTQCNHLQCFDASIFYQMNEKRARWVCPVCDKTALPGDLFIDGLFMDICQKCPSASNIIEFSVDGSWQLATESSGATLNVCTPDRRGNSPIALDTPETGKNPVVIDLTASSDEEEGEARGEDEEEEEEDEEIEPAFAFTAAHHHHKLRRLDSDETTLSDSESTISSHSSSSTTAPPHSPPFTQPHSATFPHLSIPTASLNVHISPSSSHSHPLILTSSEIPRRRQVLRPSGFSVVIPNSSVSIHSSSSDSQSTSSSSSSSSPTVSGSVNSSSLSATASVNSCDETLPSEQSSPVTSSQPTSVIMQTRPRSDTASTRVSSHSRSDTASTRVSSHPRFRVRKQSHSSSSSSTHMRARTHRQTHSSTHDHSRSGSRVESASVPSRGVGHLVPSHPLHNGYPQSGEALLPANILSLDENILNLFRASLFHLPMASSSQSHADTED